MPHAATGPSGPHPLTSATPRTWLVWPIPSAPDTAIYRVTRRIGRRSGRSSDVTDLAGLVFVPRRVGDDDVGTAPPEQDRLEQRGAMADQQVVIPAARHQLG